MLTQDQEKWVNHLSSKPGEINIVPHDPMSDEKFEKIKSLIQTELDGDIRVEHHGASSLGISGQDEIDVYIPVAPTQYDNTIIQITGLFGEPRSNYALERARFRADVDGKKIDLFVINEESLGWLNSMKFEQLLKDNPDELEQYEKLKEKNSGLSSQEYYRRKIEYINNLLAKT